MKKTQSQADENLVDQLLQRYNLQVKKIPRSPEKKTPDFLANSLSGFCFYCEMKGITGVPLSEPFLYKRANNQLTKDIEDAVEQFQAVNSARLVPNVLAWVSHDQRIVTLDALLRIIEGFHAICGPAGWEQPEFQFRRAIHDKNRASCKSTYSRLHISAKPHKD